MSTLFFLTRRDTMDDRLASEASAMGFAVARVTLLATEPGADSRLLAELLATIPEGTALAWTSRRAADSLAAAAFPRHGGKLARVPMYAFGVESAGPIREQGGPAPFIPGASAGAAELARFIARRAAGDGVRRVIFLHGDRSLPDLSDGLRGGGIDVELLEVYRTRFLDADVGELEASLRGLGPVVAAFFSPSGVEGLERLLSAEMRARLRGRATAIARGSTTARALEERGYRNVLRPEGAVPFERCALEALHSMSGGIA